MAYQVGYFTELSALSFDEAGDEMVSTFMAMPYGTYQHPVYGKIEFSLDKAKQAAEHIKKQSRGTDLDIDYDHKQYSGEAAGWVKDGEARADGMYLTVAWTKKAWQLIKDKAYRYFSPEFADEWKHPKTQEVHKNILFGGGITNRPFLKDILPLNMSELSLAEGQANKEEGKGMDPKKLRKLLGLPEDATDEQVNTKLAELPDDAVIGAPPKEEAGGEEGKEGSAAQPEGTQTIAASETGSYLEVIKRLSESSNPEVKALSEAMGGLVQMVQTQGQALQLAEVNMQVKQLMEPVEGKQLPAGVQPLLVKALSEPNSQNIYSLLQAINKSGHVKLGESDARTPEGSEGPDATKKFNDAVEKILTDNKDMSYGDAVALVTERQPDLFEDYRQSSYAFKED